jgi:hypothetical protein
MRAFSRPPGPRRNGRRLFEPCRPASDIKRFGGASMLPTEEPVEIAKPPGIKTSSAGNLCLSCHVTMTKNNCEAEIALLVGAVHGIAGLGEKKSNGEEGLRQVERNVQAIRHRYRPLQRRIGQCADAAERASIKNNDGSRGLAPWLLPDCGGSRTLSGTTDIPNYLPA